MMYLIKGIKGVLVLLFIFSILASCNYDTQIAHPNKYVKVYMPQALHNPDTYSFERLDTLPQIVYGAYYSGPNYPNKNLKVKFKVDPSLAIVYNKNNGTHYLPAPLNSYEVGNPSAIIPKGEVSTGPLYLKINITKLQTSVSGYLIPLEIVSVNGARINRSQSVTYFLLTP